MCLYSSLRDLHRSQDGTAGRDVLRDAAGGNDGSVVLAGTTNGVSGTSSDRGHSVTAVELDVNGIGVWRWQVIGLCEIYIGQKEDACYEMGSSVRLKIPD